MITVPDDSSKKNTEIAPPKRRGNPMMVKGGPPLNPHGRPRTGHALAEKVRELVDPAELVSFFLKIKNDPSAKHADRMTAANWLSERGWGKAPIDITIEADITAGPRDTINDRVLKALPDDVLAKVLEVADQQRALPEPTDEDVIDVVAIERKE